MLPPGRNGTAHRARLGLQRQLAQVDAPGGSAAPLGPAQVVTAGLLTLLIVWTLLGNVLVCAAIVRSRHLRAKMTNIFIVSLAVSDLFVALLVMPWKAVAEVAGYWPFGAFCDIWVAFDIMCSTASILNLCIISVDRYWAISRPFRYERKMTQRVALVMVALAWTLSILISFIPVQLNWHRDKAGSQGREGLLSNETPWEEGWELEGRTENCDSSLNRTYAISSSLISFYIPVAIMIVTYTRIYRIAQVQIRRISSLERAAEHAQSCRSRGACEPDPSLRASIKKETKVFKTLSVIMGVFVCCWLPFFILNCMVPFCSSGDAQGPRTGFPCVSETTFDIFVWFGWANSSLNPIIYAFNADFRKVFAQLLGCSHLCFRTPVQTVNISNELISYNQDTVFHREIAAAYVHMIPNAVSSGDREVGEEEEAEEEGPFDHMSQISPTTPDGDLAAESVWELGCEEEVSLGKISPLTPNCFHKTA
uniref:D(1B) dopamine receptor n=1 Tax=Mus spicilegus TaxID=10103 RepID=A0A8C6I602_MUSSI